MTAGLPFAGEGAFSRLTEGDRAYAAVTSSRRIPSRSP